MFIGNLLGMRIKSEDIVVAGGIISDPETGQHQIKKFKREADGSLTIVYDETAEL